MAPVEQSGYFRAIDRDLYGTLYVPDEAPAEGLVLFFPPLAEERKSACRLLVRMARLCASSGFAAFRWDMSGTGQSPGIHRSATLGRWMAESAAALDAALEAVSVDTWIGLGARLGANLAARLAAERNAAGLMLFEPILSGQDYVRDLQRRQLIKNAILGHDRAAQSGVGPDAAQCTAPGPLDLGGFEVSAELLTALAHVDLVKDLAAVPDDCGVRLSRVSGARSFPAAWQPVLDRVANMRVGEARIVRDKPFWGQLEYYESDLLLAEAEAFLNLCGSRPGE